MDILENKLEQSLFPFDVGSYQASNRQNHATNDDEEDSSGPEDALNIAVIDEVFSHNDDDGASSGTMDQS